MSSDLLFALKSDNFAARAGFLSTASASRRLLQRSPEVLAIRQALDNGTLADSEIRAFVDQLLKDLRPGVHFPHGLPLAALAVALEGKTTPFAEEYIHDLANLQVAEMALWSRVARECQRYRESLSPRTGERPLPSQTHDLRESSNPT
jgi:hypothetical protein